ncbi:unnamed protein product [Trifolium pratense]|uniref:Uncharacterized protein n=1 Tax=Trifolium pratense TaxID=57577 RepID=A0ACB0LWT1_TRIPR|nr:unnamed protein product [Trifolium pratense]
MKKGGLKLGAKEAVQRRDEIGVDGERGGGVRDRVGRVAVEEVIGNEIVIEGIMCGRWPLWMEREKEGMDARVISILISFFSVSHLHLHFHMHSYSSIRD